MSSKETLQQMGYSEKAQEAGQRAYDLFRKTAAPTSPDFYALSWDIQVGWMQAGREAGFLR